LYVSANTVHVDTAEPSNEYSAGHLFDDRASFMKNPPRFALLALFALASSVHAAPARQLEKLDRGVVAIRTDTGNFISWRALGQENAATAFRLIACREHGTAAGLSRP
jgi:hypothetical protein